MEPLAYTPEAVRAAANTLIIGKKIELHRQIGSTNDLARAAGRRGEPEGLVILAEEQVQGRGRLGRTWTAPPGSSILCSVLLRPRFPAEYAFYLTIAAALAIHRAVGAGRWAVTTDDGRPTTDDRRPQVEGRRTKYKGELATLNSQVATTDTIPHSIKWPNDVLVNGKKVAGILSESEFVGGEWAFAVVGFGVNVNLGGADLIAVQAIAPQATSLTAEWGTEIDRGRLLAQVLSELEGLYLTMQSGQFGPIYDEWVAALETIGNLVTVNDGHRQVTGQALRVQRDGSLVIKTDAGEEYKVLAGDVAET
jgi:BirA family biotin operon repressor/biotin-[acetyl-CoA-carboxylase] ligase